MKVDSYSTKKWQHFAYLTNSNLNCFLTLWVWKQIMNVYGSANKPFLLLQEWASWCSCSTLGLWPSHWPSPTSGSPAPWRLASPPSRTHCESAENCVKTTFAPVTSTGLESVEKSSTLESSTLAISTSFLEGEGWDHTCAVSDVPSKVELSSFIDSSPAAPQTTLWGAPGPRIEPGPDHTSLYVNGKMFRIFCH